MACAVLYCACVFFSSFCCFVTDAQSLVERDVLAAGSGHLEEAAHLQTVGEGGYRGGSGGVRMAGAQSLSRFPLTPQNLLSHVSHLRVRLLSLKSLRPKDKDLFVKCVLGNQTRQSDVRKRSADELVFDQEMVFRAEDLGTTHSDTHTHTEAERDRGKMGR